MNQISGVPMTSPYMVQQQTQVMPVPQPKYNAVNIEINNPTVGTPQAPVYYPPVDMAPQAPQVTIPQPPVVEQQPVPAQPVPAPVVTEPTVQQAPEVQPATEAASAEAAKPEVVPAEPVAPQVDMNAFIAKLANPDFDVQAAGMEDIANLVNESPEKATELVDSKVFDALTNIVNFDSAHLDDVTPEQAAAREKVASGKDVTDADKALADTYSPKEQAERNKSYALFTSALLQKVYGDEVARLTNTTVPLTELPGAMTTVDTLKDNPNPVVRASAIEALSYIQNPAYKKDLTTVFKIAQNDSDAGVAEAAKIALDKLDQIQ